MKYKEVLYHLQNLTKTSITQTKLAEVLGYSVQTINKRATRNSHFVKAEIDILEEHFKIDLSFMQEEITNSLSQDDCISIDYIGIKPSCGCGTSVDYEPEIKPIKLGHDLISRHLKCSNPLNLKAFTASGDSMEKDIEDGNLLLVDTGKIDISVSGIYIFTINNEWKCKRLNVRLDKSLEVISDNSKYEKEILPPDTELEIIIKGRVIKNLSRGL